MTSSRRFACVVGFLAVAACRRQEVHPGVDDGFAAELREAYRAVVAATDGASAREALARLEAQLDRAGEPSITNVQAWLLALHQFDQLERAGWRTAESSVAHAWRRVDVSTAEDSGTRAGRFESAAAAWLLRQAEAGDERVRREDLIQRLPQGNWRRFAHSSSDDNGWVLVLLARAARERGDLDAARVALELAAAAIGPTGIDAHRQRCFILLEGASIDQELGRHADAQQRMRSASESIAGAAGNLDSRSRADLEQAVALARLRQAIDVADWGPGLRIADALLAQSSDESLRAQAQFYRGFAMRVRGDREAARDSLLASMSNPALEPKLAAMARLELVAEALANADHDRANDLLLGDARLGAGDATGVWPMLDARAKAFSARVAVATGADDSPARIVAARASFRRFVDACARSHDPIGNAPFAFAPRRGLVEDILDLCLAADSGEAGVIAALEEMMHVRSRGALSRALGGTPPVIAQVRATLLRDARDRLLVLVPGLRHTHLFVVSRTRIVHDRLASPEQIAETAFLVWRDLVAPSPPSDADSRVALAEHARALATILFRGEVAEDLAACRRLLLVGGEVLRRVPLEVLELSPQRFGGECQPLGLTHEIAYLPSTAAALALFEAARATKEVRVRGGHVLIGPSDEASGPIVFGHAARSRLLRSLPPLRWLQRLDVASEPVEQIAIWFAHGAEDPRRSRPRGVVLGDAAGDGDGVVFAEHIEGLRLRTPPIHVLATCEGLNTEAKLGGEDVDHLGATLMRHGARSVLASAAPLHQEATSELIAAIVERLVDGDPIAEALRAARRELAARDRYRHPHYWATLTLFGLPDALGVR